MEYTQTRLKMEIVKDGKVYKHVNTSHSITGKEGYYTDTYKDDQGNVCYVERLVNAIKFTTHSRLSGDGNMISFSINFKILVQSAVDGCSDAELDRNILKCEHSLSKAQEWYAKESPEEHVQKYLNALQEKIELSVAELTADGLNVLPALENIVTRPKTKENCPLNNAIQLQIYKMKNPEEEIENQ